MRYPGMRVVVLLALLAFGQPVHGAGIRELMSGQTYSLSMQLKELDSEWRRFTPGGGSEAGGLMAMYAGMFGGAGNVYYSRGETVTIGSETYLIAYGRRTRAIDMLSAMERGPRSVRPKVLTGETALSLSLLNLRTVGSLTDIRAFNLEEELASYEDVFGEAVSQESLSNLKNLGLAVQMFLADNDGVMPDMTDPVAVLDDYVGSDEVFVHPETGQPYGVNRSLSERRLVEVEDPCGTAVFYEDEPADDGTRGVAFLDGHAARVTEAQWEEIKGKSSVE